MESAKKGQNPNDELREKLRNIKSENMGLKRLIMGKEKTISNIIVYGEEYKDKLLTLEQIHKREMAKQQTEVKRLQKENERLNKEIDAKKAAIEAKKAADTEEKKENAHEEVGSKIQELRKQIEAVECEKEELAQTKNIMDLNIEMTNRILEEYETDLKLAKEKLASSPLVTKLIETTESNEVKKREVEDILARLATDQQTRKAKQAGIEDLKENIEQMSSSLDTFIREAERVAKEGQENIDRVERENAMIKREFAIFRLEAKIKINEKENEISDVKERIAALQARLAAPPKKPGCFTRLFRRLFRRQK